MIKMKALVYAICLAIVSMIGLNASLSGAYQVPDNSIRYGRQVEKNQSKDILTQNMDAQTLTVFGSSELVQTFKENFDPSVVFNYKDFHLMEIGRGNYRNLTLASILGSVGDDLPQQKAVLLESLQWFTKEGVPANALLYRLSFEHVYNTLSNPKVTEEHKRAFIDRLLEASTQHPQVHDALARYKKALLDEPDNWFENQWARAHYQLDVFKNKIRYALADKDPLPMAGDKTPDYDWDQRYKTIAEQEGAADKTNNNEFQVENHYYTNEIGQDLEKFKNSDVGKYVTDSPEMKDLNIFLDIAQDLGVDVRVVLLPVNGKWYDYTGFTKEDRRAIYEAIKQVLDQRGIKYYDYQDDDYEPYVMQDMLHLGWKGWTRLEKDLYEYGKQD